MSKPSFPISDQPSINQGRRQFIISSSILAGGLLLGVAPGRATGKTNPPWESGTDNGTEFSAWIAIGKDDSVTLRVPTPEIGNGSATQVAMNIAEELGCDWASVKLEFASIQRDHIEGGIYNQGFLPFFSGHGTDKIRMQYAFQLGASARERLKAAAAKKWRVAAEEIRVERGVLHHSASNRSLRFGQVAAKAAKIKLYQEPAPKPESEWTLIGKVSPAKLHIPAIARGEAVFGIDVQVPNMVHAALKQCPVQGGTLKSHSPETVLKMSGVRAVVVLDPAKTVGTKLEHKATWGFATNQVQSAVAVIADHYWQAKMALEKLPVEWQPGTGGELASADLLYTEALAKLDEPAEKILLANGDVNAVAGAATLEHTYHTPYCENAMMEPLNGTAMVTKNQVEVWCPTQDTIQAYWVAIDETGYAPEQVKLHQTLVGGRFGRGTQADDVRMVVAVAKEFPGVPVKTIWSREECFQQGRYRTPIVARWKAVLGTDGYPTAVTSKVCFVGTNPLFQIPVGLHDQPYFTSGVIASVSISQSHVPASLLNGAYRAPCYNSHSFMLETFIDECAVAAGIDPLEYRLQLMTKWDSSWSDCLQLAAEKAGWGKPLAKGEGLGIAVSAWPSAGKRESSSVICNVARVAVSPKGQVRVKQIDVAFDCGRVANADAVRAQIEGATLFGLNMTLNEQITLVHGVVQETNFDRYPMLRLGDDLPQINVHFDALSGHERFAIIGEAPVGPVGPAIGNAIYQATGKRLRQTPFRTQDLSWG